MNALVIALEPTGDNETPHLSLANEAVGKKIE